jgi:hypothetical protein
MCGMRINWFCVFVIMMFADVGRADDLSVWPNSASRANSDPWIAQHHESIKQMRPRVLVINFSNEHSMPHIEQLVLETQAMSRFSLLVRGWAT